MKLQRLQHNTSKWFSRLNRIRWTIWVLKNLVMLVNLMALISAVCFFIVGIVGYANDSIVGILSSSLPAACIVLGVVVSLISLIGCFGAANESRMFIKLYFILMVILVFVQILIGVIAYSHRGNVESYLTSSWTEAFQYDKSLIARLQKLLTCCGFKDPTNMSVPETCPTQTPCYTRLREQFTASLNTMATVAITLGIIELICLLSASCLVYFSQLSEEARNTELLLEAHQLALAERERSKSAKLNFDNPFDVGDDDE